MDYYIVITCANCDDEIYHGICRTFLEHNGLPVVSVVEGEQSSYYCDNCEKTTYTGELEVLSEDEI